MDEKLYVVDENDKFIKYEKRGIVHSSQMWHRGIHVLLFDEERKMMLQMRSPSKDKYPNRLDCLSEHVNMNETYEDAAKRGVKEELGITTDLRKLAHYRKIYGPKDYMIVSLFEGEIKDKGKLKVDPVEITGYLFLSEKELRERLEKNNNNMTPGSKTF